MQRVLHGLISSCIFCVLTGCGMLPEEPVEQDTSSEEIPDYERIPSLVPVADYTGEEYELRDADPDMEISAEMESEIETAVKDFFRENYKTEVKMNRYFHGDRYVRAVVESVGDPLFYTEVNVGLEKSGDTVTGVSGVGAIEGEIEQAITSGLIAMVREEQFAELDELLEQFAVDYPVQGLRQEVVTDVKASRYATPFYFVSHSDEKIFALLERYKQEDEINKNEWKREFSNLQYDQDGFAIIINLYMAGQEQEPDQNIVDDLKEIIELAEGIPRGQYAILLHDANIIGRVGNGEKENSINFGIVDGILKE